MEGVTLSTSAQHPVDASGDVAMVDAIPATPAQAVIPPPEPGLPPDACETLYIQNLNETVKIEGMFRPPSLISAFANPSLLGCVYQHPTQVIKTTLRNLFKNYGPVLDVVAHRNIRMRGQAFVSFDSVETAYKALKEVKGFPLYAKPMVGILSLH